MASIKVLAREWRKAKEEERQAWQRYLDAAEEEDVRVARIRQAWTGSGPKEGRFKNVPGTSV